MDEMYSWQIFRARKLPGREPQCETRSLPIRCAETLSFSQLLERDNLLPCATLSAL